MKRFVVSSLGQGSTLGKKGENNRRGRKKKKKLAGEASREAVWEGERSGISNLVFLVWASIQLPTLKDFPPLRIHHSMYKLTINRRSGLTPVAHKKILGDF